MVFADARRLHETGGVLGGDDRELQEALEKWLDVPVEVSVCFLRRCWGRFSSKCMLLYAPKDLRFSLRHRRTSVTAVELSLAEALYSGACHHILDYAAI